MLFVSLFCGRIRSSYKFLFYFFSAFHYKSYCWWKDEWISKTPQNRKKRPFATNFQQLLSWFNFTRRKHLFYWPQKIILPAAKIFFTRRKNLFLRRVKSNPFMVRKTIGNELHLIVKCSFTELYYSKITPMPLLSHSKSMPTCKASVNKLTRKIHQD